MLFNVLLVVLGGGIGASARYLLTLGCATWFGTSFSWGTVIVNLLGCLGIGLVVGLANREIVSPEFRVFFVTGIMGGLTTFSTYAFDTVSYLQAGFLLKAVLNFLVNNGMGLVMTALGLLIVEET